MWYESKVRCTRMQEQGGTAKTVTELYMVEALTFTEAEARTAEEFMPTSTGEFDVVALKRSKINEICEGEGLSDGKWFNCKLELVTLDEQAGKERKSSYNILVLAGNIAEAKNYLEQHMQGTVTDWELKSITETKILEVYASKNINR